ncbi:hypothetical protein [Xylophilus ampelinus]|nr:hypothetical protein [Xylophilus ampelinus]MCS4510401.1 hypothetical protein [Xylophilus ampelinus]
MAMVAMLTTAMMASSQVVSIEKIGPNGSIAESPELFWMVGQLVAVAALLGFAIVIAALLVFQLYIAPLLRSDK